VKTDASGVAARGLLFSSKNLSLKDISELCEEELRAKESFKVGSYTSHIFSETEKRYNTKERELLTIVRALRQFEPVICSSTRKLWILTDYKNFVQFKKF
jgi:RNase H-like domain found in reverse transcriptase